MADEAQTIEISTECNRDLILGQVVQAVNALVRSNREDHDKIFARLEEGDQYFAVFKFSRCAFGWLNRNGVLKWGLAGSAFAAVGWLVAHMRL